MPYTVYRMEQNGGETVVACVDDLSEVGQIVCEDREKIDWEAGYHVINEGEEDKNATWRKHEDP